MGRAASRYVASPTPKRRSADTSPTLLRSGASRPFITGTYNGCVYYPLRAAGGGNARPTDTRSVRRAGGFVLTPQCLVSLCRRMDFARSRPDTGIGDRGSGAALLSVPAGMASSDGPPRQPPATPGAARATAATGLWPVCQGSFSLWERLRELVAGVAGWRLLLLCGGELSGCAGNSSAVEHNSRATAKPPVAATRARRKKEGETRRRSFSGLPAAPEQAGDLAASGESARRNCAAGGTWRTAPAIRTPPRGLPGRRTATKERTPALVSVPGSASAREHERRAAASNIPDSVSYFVSPNGPTTGPRRAPAIARHRTISWNGVSQEESGWAAPTFPISGLAGPVSWCTPEARHVL